MDQEFIDEFLKLLDAKLDQKLAPMTEDLNQTTSRISSMREDLRRMTLRVSRIEPQMLPDNRPREFFSGREYGSVSAPVRRRLGCQG